MNRSWSANSRCWTTPIALDFRRGRPNWTDSALATDYVERAFAGWPRSYPSGGFGEGGKDALAFSPRRIHLEQRARARKNRVDFGEYTTVGNIGKYLAQRENSTFRESVAGLHARAHPIEIFLRTGH